MIQFKEVSKAFSNGLIAVKDINFIIEEGEFVFLIGPSGSGKTTLIQMMIRDVLPSYGKIYFNDEEITKVGRGKVYKIRRQIGVIFQDYKLIQDQTAYENVAFAMEVAGKKNKEIKEVVPYVLEIVGLEGRMGSFPRQLSGGEQQRVAIARALANNPRLLIADELTGNLDPASAWDIVQILTKINNMGTTVLMTTHSTDIVNSLNRRVIQMEKGMIVRDDNEGEYEFESTQFNTQKAQEPQPKKKEVGSKNNAKKKKLSLNLTKHLEEKEVKKEVTKIKKPFFKKLLSFFRKSEEDIPLEITSIDLDNNIEDVSASVSNLSEDEDKEGNDQHNQKEVEAKLELLDTISHSDPVEFLTLPKSTIKKLKEVKIETIGSLIDKGVIKLEEDEHFSKEDINHIADAVKEYIALRSKV